MYQNILVAIDGSHTSEIALAEAINLAREQHGRLCIVHVIDTVNFNMDEDFIDPNIVWRAMRKSGEAVLAKALAVARGANVNVETRLIDIDTIGHRIQDMIKEEAEAWPADLIVVGTHGRRGISHLFLGSVAEGVARVATRPVLLIRGK